MSRLKPIAGELGSLWLDMKYNHEIKKDGTIVLERSDYDWKTQEEAQQFLDNWMPPEEWLTNEEVKSEADKGLKEALMCSIIKYRQIVLEFDKNSFWYRKSDYCGLCQYFNTNCSKCVLDKIPSKSCCQEWYNFNDNPTLENAIVMHNLLVNKYNELFGENDMKDEMLKIDGVDVSVSTIKNALEQAGIELKKKEDKIREGDRVNIVDGSYIIGIDNGEYSEYCDNFGSSRKNLKVIATGLSVVKLLRNKYTSKRNDLDGEFTAVNDLLVTNDKGSFWFTQSRLCKKL